MVLSTQTEVGSKRLGDEKCVRMICEAGFDALDYSMFCMQADDNILNQPVYLEHVIEVKKIVESYGKYFNQAHAPFPSFKVGEDTYNTVILEKIKRSIEIAGTLGAKNIVIHPTYYGKDSKRNLELNAEFYNNLIPLCKEYNIKIACENMFGRDRRRHCIIPNICSVGEEFKSMMDMLDPRYFTACVDIGHAGLVGTTAPEMLRTLGHDNVGCLHVHDNDYLEDRHCPPYFFDLDWGEITQALAEIDYKGDLTFESDDFLVNFPEEVFPAAYKLLHDIGRSLIKKIESKKEKIYGNA